jgi:hypothetical protein
MKKAIAPRRRKPGPGLPVPGLVPHVIRLTPEHGLARAAKRFVPASTDHCAKCGSTFIGREPAFIHCYYCGAMIRIASASLADQELFELRSGLRLAS